MITREQLLEAQKVANENVKLLKTEFDKHRLEFDNKVQEIEKPFIDLLEQYYDENLIDKNNEPVRRGNTITNGKSKYYIDRRGMPFLFGQLMFNPRVMGKKVDDEGISKLNAKEKHIHPSELKEYWIL